LDEDAAARSANMARIYQDLDFDRVALKQAWTSLGQDYTNPSAHRFLSDTLQGRPRQRIARASELLQAQLFQPINTVPVQPQLTSENIGILNSTGPGSLSSNEYDPLFTSNGAHILLNGAIGSNDTRTNNAVFSGVYDNFSFSLGQHNYRTDGFRVNDDYEQNVYNIFAQLALTPDLNIQVEFKREDVTTGDVPLRFNGFHQENFRQTIDQDTARFGLHYKINPEQDFIFSAFLTQIREIETNFEKKFDVVAGSFLNSEFTTEITQNISNNSNISDSGFQMEGQYLFHPEALDIIMGVGYLRLDTNSSIQSKIDGFSNTVSLNPILSGPRSASETTKTTTNQQTDYFNGHIYLTTEILKEWTTIIGLSFDSYNDRLTDINQFNPKIGLTWNPKKNLTLRGAVFRTLKRPLATNQTIEPTQVAGFNQFFDGINGTTAWNYGFGLDYQPFQNLYIGGEIRWRDTEQPIFTVNENQIVSSKQQRDESAHLAYLYWSPADWVAFSSEYRFDEFRRDYTINNEIPNNPRSVATHQVPLSLNMYHSSGLFSKVSGTFVNQTVEYVNDQNGLDKESDRFWIFDAAIGFRLPKRIGSMSLEVRNLFNNKNFHYNSVFDASGPRLSAFVPEREIFFKLNLAY
jgi:opacity protein-like surface antigen